PAHSAQLFRDTTPEYNNNLVARNNGKIVKKTSTVKKTTPFKRPTPISSRKADITQKTNILNHRHLKSMSVLETDTTDVNMVGNLSDTEDSRTNNQDTWERQPEKNLIHMGENGKVEEPTGEPNIAVIFSNYTDTEEACTDPISEFENSKPRLAPTLNTYKTNRKSVRIWDIPQHFSKRDITTGATKFVVNDWSVTVEGTTMRMLPYYRTKETKLERDEFSITLTKFPDSMIAHDLSDIMQQVGAKACYTPQTNESRRRFASLNFASQEDLTKATASDIDCKGHKLIWAARTAKLCHYCRDTQHMIANCNVKPPDSTRTRYGTHPRDRFTTYREKTHYNNGNQYRHDGFNRSYADVTREDNMSCPSNGMSQLEKRVSTLEKDAAHRHMNEMEEDTESTSDSTISTTEQLTETEDIKTTQSQINEKLNKMGETMAQFVELFSNNLSDQNSHPDMTSIQQ
ncbi:1015_t:CDS:2, partial [Acaulospora morrowiae]